MTFLMPFADWALALGWSAVFVLWLARRQGPQR